MDQHPSVLERLQVFEDHPELLERQRIQRYSSDPPPYSDGGSTTAPATPARPVAPRTDPSESLPWHQFRNQTARENARLIHQTDHEHRGRNQTLPFDPDLDLMANADNNIRSDWVKQGIWKTEWGPAWPKGAMPSDNRWRFSSRNPGGPSPSGLWGHEEEPEPAATSPPKAPPPAFPRNLFAARPQRKPARAPDARATRGTVTRKVTMTFNVSASRPVDQFRYQMVKETQWLADEPRYQRSSVDAIEAQAYLDVRNAWKGWGIWMPEWGPIPGACWAHERCGKRPATHGGEADAADSDVVHRDHPAASMNRADAPPPPDQDVTDHGDDGNNQRAGTTAAYEASRTEIDEPTRERMGSLRAGAAVSRKQQQPVTFGRDGLFGIRYETNRDSSQPGQGDGEVEEDPRQTRAPRRSARIRAREEISHAERSLATGKTTKRKRDQEFPATGADPAQLPAKRRQASTSERARHAPKKRAAKRR